MKEEIENEEPMEEEEEEVELVDEPIHYYIYSPNHIPSGYSPRFSPSPTTTPDRSPRHSRGYYTTFYSDLAIKFYNQNHQNDEFVVMDPLCFTTFYVDESEQSNVHVSFIAKSNSSSTFKLFFADFDRETTCLSCTIVEPGNPFFTIGCSGCHPAGAIYHPSITYQGSACDLQDGYHPLDPCEESAKRLLREAYTIKSDVQELKTEEADKLKKTIDDYVLPALEKYNHKNHASFKHTETIYSVRFRHNVYYGKGIFWVHIIFKAKETDSDCNDNSPALFFAELGLDSDSVTCVALPDTDIGSFFPGDKTSREVCPKLCSMLHPDRYANCKEGSFADSVWNGWCWAVKAELQQEAGDASDTARMHHHKQMEMEPTF